MKRLLISFLAVLAVAGAFAAKKPTVVVKGTAVEKTPVRITFNGDNAVVTFSDNTQQTEVMSDVVVRFDEDATGIQQVRQDPRQGRKDIYDLQGRKVNDRRQPKGVYVVGGRKVVVK